MLQQNLDTDFPDTDYEGGSAQIFSQPNHRVCQLATEINSSMLEQALRQNRIADDQLSD